jgi:V-type H+-transporting ATPase subunit C
MRDLIMNSVDSLLKTNDELQRIDLEIEAFLKNLEKKLLELHPKAEFTVNIKNHPFKIEEAISSFSWDEQKYPKNQKSIEQIMEKIYDKYNTTRNNLKIKTDEYQAEQEKLKQKMKSDSEAASLMKVDYREIVKRSTNHMVKSQYLTTMLVFVPVPQVEAFLKGYQNLIDGFVLPASAEKLDRGDDEKMTLWRVVIMNHKKEDFINQVRRDYRSNCKEYDEAEIANLSEESREKEKIKLAIEDRKQNLIMNCHAGYSEIYHALLHLKFLRLYSESVLKYGSNEYYSCIIFTAHGKETKVVSQMIKAFSDTSKLYAKYFR